MLFLLVFFQVDRVNKIRDVRGIKKFNLIFDSIWNILLQRVSFYMRN